MILIRASLIRIVKGFACLGLLGCVGISFLVSYAYVCGDRQDREEMHQSFSSLTRSASFIQTAQADSIVGEAKASELQLPSRHMKREISSIR